MEGYISAKKKRTEAWESLSDSYQDVAAILEHECKKIEKGHQELQAKQLHVATQNGSASYADVSDADMLDINAGGEMVRVSRGTLTQKKGTVLEAIFSGRWDKQLLRDGKGCIFLDVNPTCFRCIVDYLTDCKIAPPDCQPDPPQVDAENQPFLDSLLVSFGLGDDFINDTVVLTEPKHASALFKFLREDGMNGTLSLLYRGTRDGMTALNFHQKCDNQGPTITVAKTSQGYIFGGYADKDWDSRLYSSGAWDSSDKAFIFGLHCHAGQDPVKLAIKNTHQHTAYYQQPGHGPIFGSGNDLRLTPGSSSSSNIGHTYELPPGWNAHSFAGSSSFFLAEIEVFGIRSSVAVKPRADRQHANKTLDDLVLGAFPETLQENFEEERTGLVEAWAELEEIQNAFEKEQTAVQLFCGEDASEIVLLNVNGRSMAVTHGTLQKFPDSVFYKQFVDANWNHRAKKPKTASPREWTSKQVVEWTNTIQGIPSGISQHFSDVTGTELLALKREDIKDLGIRRPGSVALIVEVIEKLRNEEEANSVTFIEHSDYCIGKIIDHMRLKAMADLGVPAPDPPVIREAYKQRFKHIVEYYFPTQEEAAQFLG